jgi:SIR2-like domain
MRCRLHERSRLLDEHECVARQFSDANRKELSFFFLDSHDGPGYTCGQAMDSPINTVAGETGEQSPATRYSQELTDVAQYISRGECILFLGAAAHAKPPKGSSYQYPDGDRPPLGFEFSEKLAAESGFLLRNPQGNPRDLQKVALDFEIQKTRTQLVRRIREAVHNNRKPSPILRGLAELNIPLVITTNYDQLFEQALRLHTKNPIVSIYKKNEAIIPETTDDYTFGEEPSSTAPFVFKMHGDIDSPESIVITDEDYIHFVLRMSDKMDYYPVPETIRFRLQKWPIVFLGYSLMDYNLRLLFKTLRWRMDPSRRPDAYSVDRSPDPLIYDVWHNQRRYIKYVVEDVWKFVPTLYRYILGREMPQ